ncbi:MAG: tandem-95 repeat protein, partial [Verrucomicrobiaceae bacterium]
AGSCIATSEAQTPPVRIMPLGDSLTSGASNVVIPGGYRNRLYTLLTNAGYNVDYVGTKTDANNPTLPDKDHQGNGGSRIEELEANLSGWVNSVEDPDIILLLAGTNDFSQSYNIGSAQTRLTNLIAKAATLRPFAKIIVSSLPLRTDNATFESQQVAFNASIPGIVSNQVSLGRSVSYVDMHAAWTASDLDDGVHPTQAGYNKMADVWFPGITNAITPLGTLGTPPAITRTGPPVDLTHLTVRFSKPLADTAANVANYSLNGGLTVSAASLDAATKRIVTLTTSAQTPGTVYTLAVSNVKDRTAQQNTIAPGSTVAFSTDAQSNGSFELDFIGWNKTGNLEIKNTAPYTPTNGTKLVAFNAGQMTPNAVLTQNFSTTPGVSYILSFDFGALGANSQQKLQLNVAGATMLVNQLLTINGPGSSTSKWTSQSFAFLANSSTTQMSFGDASTITNGVDMLLDNVKLTAQVPRTLTVSSAPAIGVPVTVTPNDLNGNGGAPTGFSRQYIGGTTVTLVAPSTNNLNVFSKWQRNGVDFSNSTTATVTLDADYTMNAVYTNSNQVLVNGSFETGTFSPWTVSGGTVGSSAKINSVIVGTNGTKIVEFNSGNSPAGGTITQTFNTQVGATYTLAFDQGVLAYNTNQLKFLVTVTGNGGSSLLSQTSTVNGVGSGTVKWTAKSFSFVANSTTSTLTFVDTSTAISAADLLLDNVTVTGPPVIPVNNAPVAVNDSYTTNQGVALVVPAATGVLANDTDTESNPLTAAVVVAPTGGSVTLAANGGFTYTPTNGFSGSDSFTYRANDGNSNSNIATVSITVNPVSVAGLVNGSFEQGSPAALGPVTGWTQNATWPTAGAPAGHVPDGSYPANVPDGVRLLIFNAGGDIYTGSISQVFSTTPGQTYTLHLNAGVFSAGVTGKKQRLAIGITGASPLVTTVEEFTSTTGTATLLPKTYNFVADSATSTLTLADATSGVSPNSARTGSDLLVDKVSIVLAAANTPPVAVADSYSTNQNVALTIAAAGVLANDTDAESDPLTATLVAGPTSGTLNLAANGGFTYTPNNGFAGSDSFTYRANDGSANSNTVTVSLTVNAVASATLVNGSFEAGSPAALGTLDGWTQSAVWPTAGAPFGHVPDGSYPATVPDGVRLLVFNGAGNVFGGSVSQQFNTVSGTEYTLKLNAGVFSAGTAGKKQRLQITVNGTATLLSQAETLTSTAGTAALAPFTYTFTADSSSTTLILADTSGGVSPNTGADLLVDKVSIEGGSGAPNTAPTAVADSYQAQPATALVVPAATGVLANDTDAESNALSAILNVGPSSGTLTLAANGGFTYTPNNGFTGGDSFTYHANDGNLDSNVVTVNITVAAQVTQLLVNGSFESDYNGWTATGNQSVQPTSTGYGATHGSKMATFNGANTAPNAVLSQSFATVSGATYTLEFDGGVYSFNTNPQKLKVDVNGTSSLFSQVVTLTGQTNGSSTYSAKSFSFVANSTLTTLTFTDQSATTSGLDMLLDNVRVTGLPGVPNTPPVAVADSYTTNQQTALVIAAPGLLANDTDAESNPLTAAVVAQPSNGTVTVSANGGFTYTPATGFFGSDSFTYRANDGTSNSNTATVSITVNQVSIGGLANGSFEANEASWIITGNRVVIDSAAPYTAFHGTKLMVMNGGNTAPNAVISQTFTTTPGTEYTLSFNSGILAASVQQRLKVDVAGSSSLLSETIILTGNNGSASVWTPRTYLFTANSATTTLTFTDVSTTSVGGDLLLDNVAVTGAGGPTNTAPAAVADSYATPQNTALVVAAPGVLSNDSDTESNPLTAVLDAGPTSGTLNLAANGSFTYTPNNGFNGTDSFTYHANDGALDSGIVTVSITVNASGIGAFANGSFEAGSLANYTISSWTQSGTFPAAGAPLGYVPDGSYPVTVPDGTRLLVLNGGSNVYTGNVSQQFATIPGNTYSLNLNAGVFSSGTAGKKQRLLVNVAGTGTLLAAFEDLTSTTGTAALGLRSYTFVADSTVTTLTLADGTSAITASLAAGSDLLVDNVAIASITLSANAPVAFADTYTTVQDTALVVPAAGVLANDTDADSDPLTASIVANPVHGTVALAANGSFTYTPTVGYNGSDSFTYRASDGGRNSNIATVSITVTQPVVTGLVNGSFESGLFAWTESGGTEYSVNLNTSYAGTDGTTLVEFNAANSVNGGTISQTFNTVPGTVYNLTFDLGVIAFNTSQQKLQVTVNGNGGSTLLSQIATINGINGGTIKWEGKTYSFTADSVQTTLILKDVSTVTQNIDMLLDNVKANPPGGGTPPSATNLVVNPSFETGVFSPWVTTGGASVNISPTIIPTNGTKSVEFNGSNSANGGTLAQTFATTPGIAYTLQFDLGVLAYNAFQQSLKVDVTGTGSLLSQTTSINGINNGTTKWEARSFTFTADSPSTTLKFTDVSTTGSGIDVLLDYVRVTSNGVPVGNTAPTAVVDNYSTTQNTLLTVAAPGVLSNDVDLQSNPMSAVLVTPPASGTLNLAANGSFTYTPATGFTGTATFTYKANDGLLDSTPVTVSISVNAVGALVNGSFENGLTAWTKAGGTADSVKANSIITGTNGTTLVEFNSAQSPAGGSLSQTFTTVAGQSYILNFDQGVLAYNTNPVNINVKLVGSSQLVSQNFTVNGIGSGTVKFVTQTVSFTANSASTTLTFTDATVNPNNGLDLLLDYVRLTSANARTLTIDSVVASNVAMTISPSDANGAGNGTALLSRVYNLGTVVNVTAPATSASGATFSKWVKDGADYATTAATSVTISANTNLVAVYSGGTNPPLGNNIVANGSFESLNGSGWANSWANVSSVPAATRIEQPGAASGFPTQGNNILSFNVGGQPNLGVVEQALATVAGTTYTLRLDVGVYGGPTGAAVAQTLNIAAVGSSTVLSKSVTVQGTTSTFVWAPQTFTFTANSASTILRFSDGSSTGNGTDLFVDNVRVQSGTLAPSIMTVTTTPDPGKAITVTQPDLAGQTNGTSNFTRAYATGSTVNMVAPHTNFVKWLKNGAWYATNPSISVVVDANVTMTAVYTTTPVLGAFKNGSFEQEFDGWTWTGSQQSVKVKDGLPSTHGLIVVEFNSNNSGLDGAIQQTFTTTVGTTYNVAFDIGTKAFNTSQQKLRATVQGNTTLFNQVFAINGVGNGDVVYAGKTFTFTANSATTTLTFADNSGTGAGLDLLLDNVRVTAATPGLALSTPLSAGPDATPTAAPAGVATTLLSASPVPTLIASEPSISTEVIGGAKYLVLTVKKPTIPDGIKRVVEVSPDLLEWFSGDNHTTILVDDATTLKVRDNTPVTVDGKRFIRLRSN